MTAKEQFLILTNTQQLQKANAVVLLEGDGFARIKKACSLVKEGWADTLIFSGGIDNESYGSFTLQKCYPFIIAEGIQPQQIIHEATSQHTRQQAEEVVKICKQNGWTKIILVASYYHQFRAFLTFLKVLEEENLDRFIQIINYPVKDLSWIEETGWGKRIDLLQSEFDKIELYKSKGHISDYSEANKYYTWSMYQ